MPFLTDVDERAQVKGSRDPLGLIAIWSRFGREVVGNLTTVTNTVRGFTTLLLGLYFAELVQEMERDEAPSTLDVFLKFEQMAGYARVRHNSDGRTVRGLRRISATLSERKRVPISAEGSSQILSNQKVYGLWGLFSMPARASELLRPHEQHLTPGAREFVENQYIARLPNGYAKKARSVADLLRRPAFTFDVDSDLGRALAQIHGRLTGSEKVFYRDHLARGGSVDTTGGRQEQLARLLEEIKTDEFGLAEFEKVKSRAAKLRHEALATSLERIGHLERLLMPARVVFGYLLTQGEQSVDSVAGQIEKTWRRPPKIDVAAIAALRDSVAAAAGGSEYGTRWVNLAELISSHDYRSLIPALVELNTRVMQARNGSGAWLAIESGRLRVRMADETEDLLPASEVDRLWRSTYFINSLWHVSREVS